jgi:hypothetical protein
MKIQADLVEHGFGAEPSMRFSASMAGVATSSIDRFGLGVVRFDPLSISKGASNLPLIFQGFVYSRCVHSFVADQPGICPRNAVPRLDSTRWQS